MSKCIKGHAKFDTKASYLHVHGQSRKNHLSYLINTKEKPLIFAENSTDIQRYINFEPYSTEMNC